MLLDLDTFLTAVYTVIDDLYQEHFAVHRLHRPGRKPEMSDSEVLTLTLCAQWWRGSESAFFRYAQARWRPYFPRFLDRSRFNRRARDLVGILIQVSQHLARRLGASLAAYEVLDTVPVPLMRRCRGVRHRLFADEAAVGRGGSDRDWYYGSKLALGVLPEGAVTGFLLAPANTADQWVAEAFFCWRHRPQGSPVLPADLPPSHRRGGRHVGPTGPLWPRAGVGLPAPGPYLTDAGFGGAWWRTHWQASYGAVVLPSRPAPTAPRTAWRAHGSRRQVVETVNGQLNETFQLAFCGARSRWGLLTRVAAKVAALNVGLKLNRWFHRPAFALATLVNW